MKSLCIGDIHDRIDLLEFILKQYEHKVDEIIILGDFFDSFEGKIKDAIKTANYLKKILDNNKINILYGNHDLHYMFPKNIYIRGSGYSRNKANEINKILKLEDWKKFKVYYISQNFLFSHAGFHRGMFNPLYNLTGKMFLNIHDSFYDLYGNIGNGIFSAGKARGGQYEKGGITWLDWSEEFESIEGINQVVGHTPGEIIKTKTAKESTNYCIDALPNEILEIDNGICKIIKI